MQYVDSKKRQTPATEDNDRPRQGWYSTDEQEKQLRVRRGSQADGEIHPLDTRLLPYGRYRVLGESKREYQVEFRSFEEHINSCDCRDYSVNQLGTCKHIETVRHRQQKLSALSCKARQCEVFLDFRQQPPTLCSHNYSGRGRAAAAAKLEHQPVFSLRRFDQLQKTFATLAPTVQRRWRVSALLERYVHQAREAERQRKLCDQLLKRKPSDAIDAGLKLPLYPYQREGMLHLVGRRRAILADEMGLGKTVQAIAACALLQQLGRAERVLVVSPASLKGEWEEQIQMFSDLDYQIVAGNPSERRHAWRNPRFFNLCNYEQILRDGEDIQRYLAPDIIVLDEAQRIKNWQTKTADAVKSLHSPYAFVLTGTPLENRIDEIYSIMQFIDPAVFGPLFRFNRDYYQLDERGRPQGVKNLDKMHAKLTPYLLRRTKFEVEGDLPECSSREVFVSLCDEQINLYAEHESRVGKLLHQAKNRPLSPEEHKRLQIGLACMRMCCDSAYILDPKSKQSPKLDELDELLDELLQGDNKIIVFSEWTRMLALLGERLQARGVDYALHTGDVPQKKRRLEIQRFKTSDDCRLFLSSDAGSTGLNLQAANVVVNLDLPWNPAKLAQRIARAWRKHQTRPVQVINMVSENTIEHRMLNTLAEKQRLATGLLDGSLKAMDLPSGRGALIERLGNLLQQPAQKSTLPTAPSNWQELATQAQALLGDQLQQLDLQRQSNGKNTLIVVAVNPDTAEMAQLSEQVKLLDANTCIEYLSPATYNELQRLQALGLVQIQGESSALLRGETPHPNNSRLRKVLAVLRSQLKQAQAAELLQDNGFAEQSENIIDTLLPPLRKALDFQHNTNDGEPAWAKWDKHTTAREMITLVQALIDKVENPTPS